MGKSVKETLPPTWPPRNQDDVRYALEWFDTHLLVVEAIDMWNKLPLPTWPPKCKADNFPMEEWLTHMLNDQNFDRLVAGFDKWQKQQASVALQLAERNKDVGSLRSVIIDALTATYGKEYAERVDAAVDLSNKGRKRDNSLAENSLVEEGAILARQIEDLWRKNFRPHRNNKHAWTSNRFAVRYLHGIRRRVFDEKRLLHRIEIRRESKGSIDSDPTLY